MTHSIEYGTGGGIWIKFPQKSLLSRDVLIMFECGVSNSVIGSLRGLLIFQF